MGLKSVLIDDFHESGGEEFKMLFKLHLFFVYLDVFPQTFVKSEKVPDSSALHMLSWVKSLKTLAKNGKIWSWY